MRQSEFFLAFTKTTEEVPSGEDGITTEAIVYFFVVIWDETVRHTALSPTSINIDVARSEDSERYQSSERVDGCMMIIPCTI